jgi:hypothetical protein
MMILIVEIFSIKYKSKEDAGGFGGFLENNWDYWWVIRDLQKEIRGRRLIPVGFRQ